MCFNVLSLDYYKLVNLESTTEGEFCFSNSHKISTGSIVRLVILQDECNTKNNITNKRKIIKNGRSYMTSEICILS